MHTERTDTAYLDAFLQGARFSLLAVAGRLKGKEHMSQEDLRDVLDELHELFSTARYGLHERRYLVSLVREPRSKN